MGRKYENFVHCLNAKKAGLFVSIIFFLTLLPILYVGLHNYASGDDYWYGVHTYRGLVEDGLVGALKGSLLTVSEFYKNWQGTWFTMFLFTLSPHHFHEKGYVITTFLALGLLIGSFSYLADFYLNQKLKFGRGATTVIVCLVLYPAIQYIPRTTSGLFWFNGIMHYSVPFFLAVLAVVQSHKFLETKRKRNYVILFVCFVLLGGGSYLVPLAATLAVTLIMISRIKILPSGEKKKKYHLFCNWSDLYILLAFLAELIGLIISFLAPGNRIRGGEEFGADPKWALQCIYYAIDRGIYLGEDYFLKNPITSIIYLLIALMTWQLMWKNRSLNLRFRFPLLFVLYMNGIYWACYVPEIYSRSDVSGGVPNTYFHIFLIITLANIIYVTGWCQNRLVLLWKKQTGCIDPVARPTGRLAFLCPGRFKKYILIPAIAAFSVLLPIITHFSPLITTNQYCEEYIRSGKLAKYEKVREEQYRILTDPSIQDAVVPEVDFDLYPVVHMPLPNENQRLYYNKQSISVYLVD